MVISTMPESAHLHGKSALRPKGAFDSSEFGGTTNIAERNLPDPHTCGQPAGSSKLKPAEAKEVHCKDACSNDPQDIPSVSASLSTSTNQPGLSSVLPLRIKPKPLSTPDDQQSITGLHPIQACADSASSRLPSFSVPSSATLLFSSLSSERELQTVMTKSGENSPLKSPGSTFGTTKITSDRTPGLELPSDRFFSMLSPISSPLLPLSHSLSACSLSSDETFAFQDWCRESLTPRFNHLRAVLEGRAQDTPAMPSIDHPEIQAAIRKSAVQVYPISHVIAEQILTALFKATTAVNGRGPGISSSRSPVAEWKSSHAVSSDPVHQSRKSTFKTDAPSRKSSRDARPSRC